MDTEINDETTDNTMVVEYQLPPVKDQLIQAGIGLAAALAAPILFAAGYATVTTIKSKLADRKERKLAAITADTTTPDEN